MPRSIQHIKRNKRIKQARIKARKIREAQQALANRNILIKEKENQDV